MGNGLLAHENGSFTVPRLREESGYLRKGRHSRQQADLPSKGLPQPREFLNVKQTYVGREPPHLGVRPSPAICLLANSHQQEVAVHWLGI